MNLLPAVDWNPLVGLDDPYPVYRRLRDESPLYHEERSDLWDAERQPTRFSLPVRLA